MPETGKYHDFWSFRFPEPHPCTKVHATRCNLRRQNQRVIPANAGISGTTLRVQKTGCVLLAWLSCVPPLQGGINFFFHAVTKVSPRWGVVLWCKNGICLHPPCEGGGVFVLFAKMTEDDRDRQVS